ncbi:MAG: hypothetical protein LBV74_16460 [Tannerella sp.]|jgi:uncharacterized membrane protein AbrB (regulator of aidB expression)|nr:hypothetical protein [Tannerella sp.]
MEAFMALLIPIVAIVCAVGLPIILGAYVLVKLISSNNKERLELARHGIVPPVRSKPSPNKYRSLRNGVLCIGIAIGLIVGIMFTSCKAYEYYVEFLVICSSTILCLGLSYIVFYLLVKNKNMENEGE